MGRTVFRMAFAVASALLVAGSAVSQGVERQDYIVMLDRQAGGPAEIATEVSQRFGGDVGFIYGAIGGFSITLPPAAVAALSSDPRVALVAPVGIRQIVNQTIPTGIDRTYTSVNASLDIDDIDDLRVDADVAVLDSGIDRQHTDLNVVRGVNCLVNTGKRRRPNYVCSESGEDGDDDQGHGTHVAGTVAALDNGQDVVGMAPGARLWAVKVCDNRGDCPDDVVVAGIDWVIANGGDEVEVINMSLTGPTTLDVNQDPYQRAIDDAVAAGIVVVVAAGNNGADVAGYTPSRIASAITVSAIADYDGLPGGNGGGSCSTGGLLGTYSGPDDATASFSNYGDEIDITAPGVCILSTKNGGGTELKHGTSMAAPHVTGVVAVIASTYPKPLIAADVTGITNELMGDASLDYAHSAPDGVKEPLLENTIAAAMINGTAGPDETPPTPVITSSLDSPTSQTSVPLTIDFGEPVNGFDGTDLMIVNGTAGAVSGSDGDQVYTVTIDFNPANDGTVMTVDIAAGAAADLAGNLSNAAAQYSVTYQEPVAGAITLSATGYKVRGVQNADLAWSGANGTNVDIRRDGAVIAKTVNDGIFTDNIGNKGGGSYVYEVCEEGTSICSDSATVVF